MLLNFAVCILHHWLTMIVHWRGKMGFIDVSFPKTGKFSLEMSPQRCVRNAFFNRPIKQLRTTSPSVCSNKSLPIFPASCWFSIGPPMFRRWHRNNAAARWSRVIRQTPSWVFVTNWRDFENKITNYLHCSLTKMGSFLSFHLVLEPKQKLTAASFARH